MVDDAHMRDRVQLQLRLDALVWHIDEAERRNQRLRAQALLLEYELVAGEMVRLALADRAQEDRP
jgi:hypothetical protein